MLTIQADLITWLHIEFMNEFVVFFFRSDDFMIATKYFFSVVVVCVKQTPHRPITKWRVILI